MSEQLITIENDGGAVALPPEFAETLPQEPPVAEPPAQPPAPPAVEQPAADEDPAVRGLKAEISRLREEGKTLKQRAEAADTIREAISRHPNGQDIIAALRTGQSLTAAQQRVVDAATQRVAQPQRSAEETVALTQLAESLSLYTTDGKADIEAAGRVAGFTRAEAKRAAELAAKEVVKPFQQRVVNDEAAKMRGQAVDAGVQFGLEREFVEPIIDNIVDQNPEVARDPNNMSTAVLVACGLKYIQERQKAGGQTQGQQPPAQPPTSPPIFREGGTGKPAAPTMSTLESRIASQIGAKDADWLKHTGKLANITDATKLITLED